MYILDNIMRRTLDIRQRRCKRRLRVEKDKKKKTPPVPIYLCII